MPATVIGICDVPGLVVPGAILVAAVVGAHLVWIVAMVRDRKRPALDWGLRFVLGGAVALVAATVLGQHLGSLYAAGRRLEARAMVTRAALACALVALGVKGISLALTRLGLVPPSELVWILGWPLQKQPPSPAGIAGARPSAAGWSARLHGSLFPHRRTASPCRARGRG